MVRGAAAGRRGSAIRRPGGGFMLKSRYVTPLLLALLLLDGAPLSAQTADVVNRNDSRSARILIICHSPTRRRKGSRNKIAEVIAGELGVNLDFGGFPKSLALSAIRCAPIFVIW